MLIKNTRGKFLPLSNSQPSSRRPLWLEMPGQKHVQSPGRGLQEGVVLHSGEKADCQEEVYKRCAWTECWGTACLRKKYDVRGCIWLQSWLGGEAEHLSGSIHLFHSLLQRDFCVRLPLGRNEEMSEARSPPWRNCPSSAGRNIHCILQRSV